jgi:hypothetical protein
MIRAGLADELVLIISPTHRWAKREVPDGSG